MERHEGGANWEGGAMCGREEGVVAAGEHGCREGAHEWLRLEVKVTEHLVRFPAAEQSNKRIVGAVAEESHGSRRAKRAS